MSLFDRLLRRNPKAKAAVMEAMQTVRLTEDEARMARLALWEEMQRNPTPERAAVMVKEAEELLAFFHRDHPLHDNIQELMQTAKELANPTPLQSDT